MLTRHEETGKLEQIGVNVNELIAAEHREPFSDPLHKYIRCRSEIAATVVLRCSIGGFCGLRGSDPGKG